MKATVDPLGTATNVSEGVMGRTIMEWQHLSETLQEKIELEVIERRAGGIIECWNSYERVKAILHQFGPQSDEYRIAFGRFSTVRSMIELGRDRLEERKRLRSAYNAEILSSMGDRMTDAERYASWKASHQQPNLIVSDEDMAKYEELFIPDGVRLPEVVV